MCEYVITCLDPEGVILFFKGHKLYNLLKHHYFLVFTWDISGCEIHLICPTVVLREFFSWHIMNPLFFVYCLTVRHLQGLSWPFPDCFVFVCLCLSPDRRELDCRKSLGEGGIPFPGLIAEADGSDMSWLKQHHFCPSCLAADLTNDAVGSRHMPLSMPWNRMGFYPLHTCNSAQTPSMGFTLFSHLSGKKSRLQQRFSLISLSMHFSSSCPACVLLPPVSVGLRRVAEASLTGVWVLITHVSALISGPQLPASSLVHASEWGYISLSLWPETFLSISFGLSPSFSLFLMPSYTLIHSHIQKDWLAGRQDEVEKRFILTT